MAVNFQSLLSIPADSIEKPKPLPAGSYSGVILGYELKEIGQKATPGVTFSLRGTGPGSDIDEGSFQEAGGMEALSKRKLEFTFYLTADSIWRLTEFFRDTLELETAGKTVEELLAEVNGQAVGFILIHKPAKNNPADVMALVDRLIKAE